MDLKSLLKPSAERYDWALTIIRIIVGLIFFMHGWQKLFMMGIPGVGGFFGSLGIPAAGFMAALVTFLELLGGLALILGVATRVVAALLAINMLVALLLVHLANGFFASNGGYEFVLILMAASVAFVLSGAGSMSIDARLST
ncbi:MAG: DoxX family protein [Ardenticatenaceae bacterium]|nr:DoxX family protein [Ardenticatenaceae bacterium]